MKIDTLFFRALFLTGTGLWTRIAIQGLELGLLAAAIEWFMNRVSRVSFHLAQIWSVDLDLIERVSGGLVVLVDRNGSRK